MSARFCYFLAPLLLAAAGCYPGSGSIPQTSPQRTVEVVPLSTEKKTDDVTLIGEIEPCRETTMYFEVTGIVDQVLVESGDCVEEGDSIARLVQTDFELGLSEATAQRDAAQAKLDLLLAGTRQEDLAVSKAEYERTRVRADYWRRELMRIKELFQQGAASATQLEEVQREHDASHQAKAATKARWDRALAGPRQEEIEAAKAEVRAQNEAVGLARRRLEKATMTAPFRGRVEKRFVDEGAYINIFPTGGVPVVHLVDFEQVDALIAVPEKLRNPLAAQRRAEVASAVDPSIREEGKIVSLSNVADSASGTYELRVRLPNPKGRFTSGMVVTLTAADQNARSSIHVPVGVVAQPYGQSPYVLLVQPDDGRVVSRDIQLGPISGDRVEVTAGLTEGELLIVRGQHQVVPGDRVQFRRAHAFAANASQDEP